MRGLSTNERIIVSVLRSAGRITIETTTEDGGIIRVAVTDREELDFLYRKFSYLAGKEPQDSQRFSYYVGIADTLRTILKLFNTR